IVRQRSVVSEYELTSCTCGVWRHMITRKHCRSRIGCKGACMLKLPDLQGSHTLAKHSLESRFPTRFNLQLLPQAPQGSEFVLFEPWLQRALLLNVFLQTDQRRQPGLKSRQLLRLFTRLSVRPLALCIKLGQLVFEMKQLSLRFFEVLFEHGQFAGQTLKVASIGGIQFAHFELQPLAPLLKQ